MTSFNWPPSGGSGVDTYPTFAAFPVSAADGTLAVALDTRIVYEYSTTAMNWAAVGGPGVALSVGTLDSEPKVADGLQIVGSDIVPQTADSTYPGLMTSADYDLLRTAWVYAGNAATTPGTDFIGTSDAQDFVVKTNGITQLTFDKDGGWYSDQNQVPVDGSTLNQYTLDLNVNPAGSTTTADNVGLNLSLEYDNANAGFDHAGRMAPAEIRFAHNGSGDINSAFLINGGSTFSSVGGTTALFKAYNADLQVQGTHTVTSLYGFFTGMNNTAGAVITGGTAYSSNVYWNDATIGSYYSTSFNLTTDGTSAVSGGIEGVDSVISIQGASTVTNQTIGINSSVSVSGTSVANYVQGINANVLGQNGATASSMSAINCGVSGQDTADIGNVTAMNANVGMTDASVAGGMNAASFTIAMEDTSSNTGLNGINASVELYDTSVTPNALVTNLYLNTHDDAEIDNITVVNATSTLDSTYAPTNFQIGSWNANVTGAAPTNGIAGLNISLNSTTPIPTGVTGININLSGATLDPSVLFKTGLNISDGAISAGANVTLPGALPFYQINYIAGQNTVAAGTPTGAYGFGNNFAHLVDFQDDWTPDATTLRLGFVDVGFVGSIFGAAGKTMDSWTGALGGAGNPSGAGTIDQMIMFRAAGLLPQGGATTVNNAYGLYVMPTISAVATNAWGVFVEDTNANNWFAKNVVIGGMSGTPTNSDVALEIASQKAILGPVLTTAQKNALTGVEGMFVYDTDNDQYEYYDGASWVAMGSGTGFITSVSDTSTIDLTVTANDLTADIVADSITNTHVNTAAAIARSKLASGTNYRILANDSSGVMSENAALTANRIIASDANGQLVATSTADTALADFVSGPASSVDGEIALFDSTTGKLIKRATGTGVVKATSGVYSTGNVDLASEVTGTLPIANGGTGQTSQTAAFDALAPTTTKGDLIVHDGTDNIRVAVGTNDFVLTADSTAPSGVKWAAATGATPIPPLITVYNSGSGTHTFTGSPLYVEYEVMGGGGGGGGNNPGATAGGSGGNSTFAASTGGGGGGGGVAGTNTGGTGGTASIGVSPTPILVINGANGSAGNTISGEIGAAGASSYYGGAGAASTVGANGGSAVANSGSGGAGSSELTVNGGGSGGAGGFVRGMYAGLDLAGLGGSASYSVGAGGTAGAGNTQGGAGGSGKVIVIERYQ